jgi:hypothetical protein
MRFLVLALGVLMLTACVTTEERLMQQALSDHWTCRDYGFQAETDAYAQCRMNLVEIRENRQAASQAAAVQNLGVLQMQLQQQETQRRAAFEASIPKVQNTQCQRIGYNQLNCTTW